ncbi:hypothetical protein F5B20DRAFT_540250 [Whalleya microplaca]|nr:hypothetical protein F5B20DRAFT_540250 [Whalleya microplaca]
MATLPLVVIREIFVQASFSQDDLKSLRLVCRSWTDEAKTRLFARVCLSRLKSDHDNFFNIAARPHLAQAVRVLAWQELHDDETDFEIEGYDPHIGFRLGLGLHLLPNTLESDDERFERENFSAELKSQMEDLFWLPGLQARYIEEIQDESSTIDENSTEFGKEATANLTSFLQRLRYAFDAMPNLHTIISQPMHPFRELTKSNNVYPLTAQVLRSGPDRPCEKGGNKGFHNFLLKEMVHRNLFSKNRPITRLQFADECFQSSIIAFCDPDIYKNAFAPLTHLDLSISHTKNVVDLYNLKACIKAATGLTNLRLCFQRENSDAALQLLLGDTEMYLPKLRSLHIEDMSFTSQLLLDIITRHAHSLRRLRINADVPMAVVYGLSEDPSITLDEFTAVPQDGDFIASCQSEMLKFINHGIRPTWLLMHPDDSISVSTHTVIFKRDGCAAAAICECQAPNAEELGNSAESLSLLDVANGKTGPKDEITVTEETTCGGSEGREMQDAEDHNAKYARENAEHLKRKHEAPRWQWDFDRKLQEVFYWKVDAPHGIPTEMWRFEQRNGEVAYGDDPLEFFEDWEGSEAGDKAEPTPFGRRFKSFIATKSRGELSASGEPCDGLYVRWDDEDDDWLNYC